MGKFSRPSRPDIQVDSDVIKDIHNQLSSGRKVLILYDPSEISRQSAQGLLKKIPTDDVYRVLMMDKNYFEEQKSKNPDIANSYQILAEKIFPFIDKPR